MMMHYQHQDDHIVIGSVTADEEALAVLLNKFSDKGIQPTLVNLLHEGEAHLMMIHHKDFTEIVEDPVACLAKAKEILGAFGEAFELAPEQI